MKLNLLNLISYMMNKRTKYIIIGLFGSSFIALFLFFNFIIFPSWQTKINEDNENIREKQFEVSNVTLIVDYSGVKDNDLFKNINLTNYKTTVYHALLNCCEVAIQDYDTAIYVKEINGVGEGWTYTVNNEPLPNIPANYFYLLDNDTVKWTYIR